MKKDIRDLLLVAAAAMATVCVIFGSVYVYSGTWPPFSLVESGSMQHGDESSVGIIDTGDMVVIRETSEAPITSYVEGYRSGYSKFGEYGDVIIYERLNSGNPIIHRAILWIDHDNGKWSAPSLERYTDDNGDPLWSNIDNGNVNTDCMNLTGTLTLRNIGYSSKTVYVDLSSLRGESGYLTMGDNGVTNTSLDQYGSGFSGGRLVSPDRILYVAGFEIPWIGCVKLYASGNTADIPSNSVPTLIFTIIAAMVVLITIPFVYERIVKYIKESDDDEEDRSDPDPPGSEPD